MQAANKRKTFRQSLERVVALRVTGLPISVEATLTDISVEGCRVRSSIALPKDASVRFDMRRGRKKLDLRGRITSRRKNTAKAAYEYGITFERATADSEALVAEVMELQRRAAAERSEAKEAPAKRLRGAQKRGAFRALVAIPVRYQREGRPSFTAAEANDLSASGLRLLCRETFPLNVVLTFELTLPSEVLEVYSEHVAKDDPSPFGKRGLLHRPNPAELRRPFEQMVISGKVTTRSKDAIGRVILGIKFIDLDSFSREEIQRYIHALQLHKIRTNVENL